MRTNRADSKTLLPLLVTLPRRLAIQERTFLFDGGRKKAVELGSTRRRGGLAYPCLSQARPGSKRYSRDLPKRSLALAYRAESSDRGGRQWH
ncbi:hypothetical protein MPNT_10373 [Candidatus Methylacidithermus pantelleriae]|uniref:Uncharacterized protein n=1 Tax=Candidatus Methylacidithermus pantelleriae TaxID=2744239 RepID=A0A8J2BJQ4_9BACT|nr:hypothetical protein MPNT_10373 [Candidatus Methylacidithermus pantelleriae]